MHFIQHIRQQAKEKNARVVLPEWDDARILQAAFFVAEERLATAVFVGDQDSIFNTLKTHNCYHKNIEVIHFDAHKNEFAKVVQEKYAKKVTLSETQTNQLLNNNIHQGALLLDAGKCDCMVAGVNTSTADVIRTSLKIVGLDTCYKTASSFFIMLAPTATHKNNKMLIFADCALVVEPDANQLADICVATIKNATHFLETEPMVAMLSFSTEGSATHANAQKVAQATQIVKQQQPTVKIIGEVQFDAALNEEVARIKLKQQTFTKPANILIFPDLNAANIGYKICQRLAGYQAIGPVLQGFRLPVNDLSRGATVDDIINLIAVTSVQCA